MSPSPAPSTCCSSCSCATPGGCSATRRSSRRCGVTTLARAQATCGSTSATCAPSSRRQASRAYCTPCAGSGTCCGTRRDTAGRAVTLRNRVAVAAAAGVLIVVAAVSSVLYVSYAASLRSRVDATLVDAAQQATGVAGNIIKQAAARSQSGTDIQISVGGVEVQLFPSPAAGLPTQFGPLGGRDVAVAGQERPAYLSNLRDAGQQYRVYTAAWLGNPGGLVRTSRPASADDGALRDAALLLAGLTIAAAGVTYGAARLAAG